MKGNPVAQDARPAAEPGADRRPAGGGAQGVHGGLSAFCRGSRLAPLAGRRRALCGACRDEGELHRAGVRTRARVRALRRDHGRGPTSSACRCAIRGRRTTGARRRWSTGHTPVPEAEWLNNTLNLDTGCVFGGKLTALRWPEREIVETPALRTYAEPVRPFLPTAPESSIETPELSLQWQHDELLRAEDVLGKRIVTTRLMPNVIVPAENAAAALEVMSRFAAEPRWLLYLPPTMSPCETAPAGDLLERPQEAFSYYRSVGVTEVVCQRKHMGSRAVVVICKDADAARQRFGATTGEIGQCVTRTGRRFFDDPERHNALLEEFGAALTRAGFWEEFATDWACFDCELMPWNAKAQGAAARTVRAGRHSGGDGADRCDRSSGTGAGARAGGRRTPDPSAAAPRRRDPLSRRLCPLLLGCAGSGGDPDRAVPPAGDGRQDLLRPGPPLAHADTGPTCRAQRSALRHGLPAREHRGGRVRRYRNALVGGDDGRRVGKAWS